VTAKIKGERLKTSAGVEDFAVNPEFCNFGSKMEPPDGDNNPEKYSR
jgi:hypothetical protein